MKVSHFKAALLAAVVCVVAAKSADAQIVYSSDSLTITGKYNKTTGLTNSGWKAIQFHHFGGCFWDFNSGRKFYQLDITAANPRIAGTGNTIVFFNTASSTYNSIEVANVYNHSDARSKTNVEDVNSGLSTVLNLRPVSFNWKDSDNKPARVKSLEPDADGGEDNSKQYGFLAQEVEEVMPEIVKESNTGEKVVNYMAIIPLLVQSVHELQQIVESQALKIEQLSSSKPMEEAASVNKIISCTPNPTSGYVSIETNVDSGVDAQIIITSMSGSREKSFVLSGPTVSGDVSSLPAGIHIVALYVSGGLVDTCRLIKQ